MNPFLAMTILASQFLNSWIYDSGEGFGQPDEMVCSRAWRRRNDHAGWKFVQWFVDNWTPFGWWHGPGKTHCEDCYTVERERLWLQIHRQVK